jgi:glycine/D-amino acid oxidase-like deaminating enzyme
MPEQADVVIVGGGILGTALAWQLAQRKYRVVLLEARRLAGEATGRSFAWANASTKWEEETYHRLNAEAVAYYDTLADAWGAERIGLHGGGALFWAAGDDADEHALLRQRGAALRRWGYPVETLDADAMRALEPGISFAGEPSGNIEGLFAPADRWVDVDRLIAFLAERAQEGGAQIREDCPATGFERAADGSIAWVDTPSGRVATDRLVVAAGVRTPELVSRVIGDPAGGSCFPIRQVPGILVETAPGSAPEAAHRVLHAEGAGGIHLRPTAAGGLLMGATDLDELLEGEARSEQERRLLEGAPDLLLRRAVSILPTLPIDTLRSGARARLCVRPVPADGFTIVGPVPGVNGAYAVVTHSGITLGPMLADLLAAQIDTLRAPPLLSPYSPDRFKRESETPDAEC